MSQDELQRTLGKIEGKLDELLRRADNHDDERTVILERLASLENSRSWLSGAVGILSAVVAFGVNLLMKRL